LDLLVVELMLVPTQIFIIYGGAVLI